MGAGALSQGDETAIVIVEGKQFMMAPLRTLPFGGGCA